MSARVALDARRLGKTFGGVNAIGDVSFAIDEGSLTALIGPNGAGKSTLFNLVTNLYVADSGSIEFFGIGLAGKRPDEIARLGLIRTFQTARVFAEMSVLENMLAGAHLGVKTKPWQQSMWLPGVAREERALRDKAEALLDLIDLSGAKKDAATSLPLGSQKLLEIGRALMAAPRLLLLDEPAAGLNETETDDLARLISAVRASGTTVMVVEHNMSLVMGIADDVLVLDAGKLIARGSPAQIQTNGQVIEAYVGRGIETPRAEGG